MVENAALRATEQQRLDELSHQAFHDSLTELPNRALFADRLGLALARTNRRKAAVAVLFLDLDDFKPINDRFGHDAGDRLLIAGGRAGARRACGRRTPWPASGGDEFTVLLEDIVDVRYAIGVAERIEDSLREPFPIDGHEATVTASIGIAVTSGAGVDARGPDAQLRPGDVPGQAQGPRAARPVRLGDRHRGRGHRGGDRSGGRAAAGAARGQTQRPRVEEQLAVEEELAAEAAIEDAMVVEHAEAAPLDDGADEEPEAAVGAARRPRRPHRTRRRCSRRTPAEEPAGSDSAEPDDEPWLRGRAHRGTPAAAAALPAARLEALAASPASPSGEGVAQRPAAEIFADPFPCGRRCSRRGYPRLLRETAAVLTIGCIATTGQDSHADDESRPAAARRSKASAMPIRSTVVGWVPNANWSAPGGSGSETFASASRRSSSMNWRGSPVELEREGVGRGLDRAARAGSRSTVPPNETSASASASAGSDAGAPGASARARAPARGQAASPGTSRAAPTSATQSIPRAQVVVLDVAELVRDHDNATCAG